MGSLKSAFMTWLPRDLKKSFQQLLLGYHSSAPSFSAAGEDMILRHIVGSDKRDGFYVDVEKSEIVRLMKGYNYEVCAQNVIILGKINEYFFIDKSL